MLLFEVGLAGMLWSVVVVRHRLLLRPGPARALGVALVALACEQTLRLPGVGAPLAAAASRSGLPVGVLLLAHTCSLLAAAAILILLEAPPATTTSRHHRRYLSGVVLLGVLSVVSGLGHALTAHTVALGTAVERIHWLSYFILLDWSLTRLLVVSWRYRRLGGSPAFRCSLRMVATGSVCGLAYPPAHDALAVALQAPTGSWWVGVDRAAQTVVVGACLSLLALGTSWPAIVAAWYEFGRVRGIRRSLATLGPLWSAVTDLVPGVVLPMARPGGGGFGRFWPTARELRLRQLRRVAEIEDALLWLRGRSLAPGVHAAALRAAGAGGLQGRWARAAAEAAWIHVASVAARVEPGQVAARVEPGQAGTPAQDARPDEPERPADLGIGAEVLHLEDVARFYADPAVMARLLDPTASGSAAD